MHLLDFFVFFRYSLVSWKEIMWNTHEMCGFLVFFFISCYVDESTNPVVKRLFILFSFCVRFAKCRWIPRYFIICLFRDFDNSDKKKQATMKTDERNSQKWLANEVILAFNSESSSRHFTASQTKMIVFRMCVSPMLVWVRLFKKKRRSVNLNIQTKSKQLIHLTVQCLFPWHRRPSLSPPLFFYFYLAFSFFPFIGYKYFSRRFVLFFAYISCSTAHIHTHPATSVFSLIFFLFLCQLW